MNKSIFLMMLAGEVLSFNSFAQYEFMGQTKADLKKSKPTIIEEKENRVTVQSSNDEFIHYFFENGVITSFIISIPHEKLGGFLKTLGGYMEVENFLIYEKENREFIGTFQELADKTRIGFFIIEVDAMQEIIKIPKLEPMGVNIKSPKPEFLQKPRIILHCCVEGGTPIRLWKTTFLQAYTYMEKVKLIYAENIPMFPQWFETPIGKQHWFTLYFPAFSGRVTSFILIEEIPERGGFFVIDIKRNLEDVYYLNIEKGYYDWD